MSLHVVILFVPTSYANFQRGRSPAAPSLHPLENELAFSKIAFVVMQLCYAMQASSVYIIIYVKVVIYSEQLFK